MHITNMLGGNIELEPLELGLLALQGPKSALTLGRLYPGIEKMPFLSGMMLKLRGITCFISRSGYTGEDGFEISVKSERCADLLEILIQDPDVCVGGLGARDTLRLEAGLCLYGSDIDSNISPVEAGLTWSIGKQRREIGGFLGDAVILNQIRNGTARKRVGICPGTKAIARAETQITNQEGKEIGFITSGGFGPTVDAPIAMGYVTAENALIDTEVNLLIRKNLTEARVVKLPFVRKNYFSE